MCPARTKLGKIKKRVPPKTDRHEQKSYNRTRTNKIKRRVQPKIKNKKNHISAPERGKTKTEDRSKNNEKTRKMSHKHKR